MHSDNKFEKKPVLAVLVNNNSISGLQKQSPAARVRMMTEANKEVNNRLYFFSLNGVRLKEQKISGYYWHKKRKRWLHREFSLPNILYVRCGIDKRYAQTFSELCKLITDNHGKLITHHRFNKWRLYQIMNKDQALKNHLPLTRTVRNPDDIKKMLQRYNVVYLKSHIGRKGENVFRVEILPRGAYRYSYFRDDQLTVRTVDYKNLLTAVNTFFGGRKILAQQGIELLKYKNRLIDMRAELQHNGSGGLEILGISVRHGKPGSPITTHGNATRFEDFLRKKMGYSESEQKSIYTAVRKFLFNVYEYIENNYDMYAEMGIDFAIDANKKIWFIEANAQSTHVSLNKAYGDAVLYRYNKNILEYAGYLFQQSQKEMS